MRRTTILLTTCLLLAGAAVGCSKSYDENAKDCTAALAERTGGDSADRPTVEEAKERAAALDSTLASMVRTGYESAAKEAFDAVEKKTKEGGKGRPEACEPLSEDDYTALLTAEAIDGLGWTGGDGRFDKLKMVESLGG
jgi:ABC-type Fe3+-hydroxamate transport system substrate-binding protein